MLSEHSWLMSRDPDRLNDCSVFLKAPVHPRVHPAQSNQAELTKCLGAYQPLGICPDVVIGRLMKPRICHSSYLRPPRRRPPLPIFYDSFGVFSPVNLPPTRYFFLPLHLPPPPPPTRSSSGSSFPLTPPSLALHISLLRSEHAPLCLRAHACACACSTCARVRV